MLKLALALAVFALIMVYLRSDDTLVKTRYGELKGKYWLSRSGRSFLVFTKIPYAKPPLGSLRFQSPVSAEPWDGILDATIQPNVCPQVNIYLPNYPIVGDEDCLFLNVYTPRITQNTDEFLPVMFYIHGGSFVLGSGIYDWLGPEILMDKDVVLVTLNYRLGSLGFLSTGDEWAYGNNGLKDQILALNWTKENIAYFGGDPEKITVFGNSAGAACTHYHMISPRSKGLLNRAIVQSGSAYAPYAITSKEVALHFAQKLGAYLNCSTNCTKDLVICLQSKEVYEIIKQELNFLGSDNDTTLPFRIVVEPNHQEAFLTEDPIKTAMSGKLANIPLMVGMVAQEGAYKTAGYSKNSKLLQRVNDNFHKLFYLTFSVNNSNDGNLSEKIKTFYFGDKGINNSTKLQLTDLYTDGFFLWGVDKTLQLHFKYSSKPIYQYLFAYRGSTSYSTVYDPINNYGVCHTDELLYLFKLKLIFPSYTPSESDEKVTELMTTLWTNFARTGNPTPEVGSVIPVKWNPVQSEKFEYYHIKSYNDISMEKDLFPERKKLWRELPIRTEFVI